LVFICVQSAKGYISVMSDWIDIKKDPVHVKRERAKARELRKSDWWNQQLAKGICHYCGQKFQASELTMDHILPVVRGGKSVKSNCVPCCKECNNEKKFLTPAELIMRELENPES
jgi:5-methylcytosine-specific restriction enzyme A